MFRWFEGVVDPYSPYEETDAPPPRLIPFLHTYAEPFKGVFTATGVIGWAMWSWGADHHAACELGR